MRTLKKKKKEFQMKFIYNISFTLIILSLNTQKCKIMHLFQIKEYVLHTLLSKGMHIAFGDFIPCHYNGLVYIMCGCNNEH